MLGGSNAIYPVPCKTGGYIGPFPLTLPKYLPAAALQVLGQYCPCSGKSQPPAGHQGRVEGERGKEQRGTDLFSSCPSRSLSLQQVWDTQGVSGTSLPGRVSLTSQHWASSAPKLPAAGPVASEKLYELFGRERVVNYHVPLLLTSANKSNYHRLMNRAQAHPRSCR